MAKRAALAFLALASPLILLAFLFPQPLAQGLFASLALAFPVALMVLGASRQGRLGPLALPLLVLLALLEGGGLAMLALRGRVADGPWLGGLPLAAAIELGCIWLAPLPLVALAYALTFDLFGLRQADLERLRGEASAASARREPRAVDEREPD